MTASDAPQIHTFDDKFSDLRVRGATWVEYWLQLDDTPIFNTSNSAPNVQILHENRCVGGAAVAARALWNWGLAVQLETELGDDPNANFARRTVENDWQQVAEQWNAQGEIPTLKLANLSEREQAYRVHLCAPQNRAQLQHGFCDETLRIQWQDRQNNRGARCVEWRAQQCWLDNVGSMMKRCLSSTMRCSTMRCKTWRAACKYLQRQFVAQSLKIVRLMTSLSGMNWNSVPASTCSKALLHESKIWL